MDAAQWSNRMYSTVVNEGSDCNFTDYGIMFWAWSR